MIEREIRFYFPLGELKSIQTSLKQFNYDGRYHEITIMYDNPNPILSFYSDSIDGRLRLRVAKQTDGGSTENDYGLVSWKQRIPALKNEILRHENEIEFSFNTKEMSAVQSILENVLHCPRISSYERYRSYYKDGDINITLDEFPFALMLELEIIGDSEDGEDQIINILSRLKLSSSLASSYSCDDMYWELCIKESKEPKSDILFSNPDMPLL